MATSVLSAVTGEIPWMPGAREIVRELSLAGVRQGIVTSSFRDIAMIVADATDGAIDPALVITRDDVVEPKPDPEPYLVAGSRVAGRGYPILAIEDSVSGVASAVAAGLPVLAVGEQAKGSLADAWIPTLVGQGIATLSLIVSLETSDD